MAIFSNILTALGLVSVASTAYSLASAIWVHFIRTSSLPKYRHGDNKSWGLVTGASDGIGYATARELLRNGFNVFLHGRNEKKLSGIASQLRQDFPSLKVEIIVADASAHEVDFTGIAAQVSSVTKQHNGRLTVLVNNVGGVTFKPQYCSLEDTSAKNLDEVIAINARFPTRLTSALMPQLKANQPSLILIAGSNAGLVGLPYLATYGPTKAYCHHFACSLRAEFLSQGYKGIEVQACLIGNTASAGNKVAMAGTISSEECAKGMLRNVGCGRTLVAPHWKPGVIGTVIGGLPEGLQRVMMAPEMKGRYENELKAMKGQ
ncbi:hypothetical protein B0A48_17788 [Cryoendolithus antarcticus]|uniref:Very-long-chain 3-oxoacyl-CoA reductase n=1 Tax=Cryoendolithus antarcticus TaxID=1507870 RepID=A0A1V8SAR0_9PEZI|nr:hypothetical protein B0A48_17788 [Cryoendolithus antarcticus]